MLDSTLKCNALKQHLTREQRHTIEALLQIPMSLREIGEVIGVSTGSDFSELTY